jgi:hypothetical protein
MYILCYRLRAKSKQERKHENQANGSMYFSRSTDADGSCIGMDISGNRTIYSN